MGKDCSDMEDPKIPEFDAGMLSTPQVKSANRVVYNPRGKGLGGSSLLNWMQLIRQRIRSNNLLQSQNLPKASEQPSIQTDYVLKPEPALYGDGPIVNTFPRFLPAINQYYYKACAALGVPFNPVGGNGNNFGVWPSLSAIDPKTCTRVSSATAYLEPNRKNPNLKIISQAQATRILFEKSSSLQVAKAVVYLQGGETPQEFTVIANKEVIVYFGGSYRTPQLLELSGIGDSSHVLGDQIIDLPGVGNNLRETFIPSLILYIKNILQRFALNIVTGPRVCLFLCETKTSIDSYDILMNPNPDLGELRKERRIPHTQVGIFSAVPLSFSYVPLKMFTTPEKIAKIKQMAAAANTNTTTIVSPSSIKALQNLINDDESYHSISRFIMVPHHVPFLPNGEFDSAKKYFFLSVVQTHPFSRGSIHLDPTNPTSNPVLDLGLFENDIDLEIIVEGLKFMRKIIAQPSLRDDAGVRPIAPSAEVQSDDEIKEYARQACFTSYHPVGSASMLPREEGGVVDPDLVVHGTTNLRIVDASILPINISAHPMATVYAIAEKVLPRPFFSSNQALTFLRF
ncbi:GMC oxidoreductase-domain-containing protein [Mycena leptocephala]|nr:GMC oxidoreductase-domain-containing protein [Mycena leptocephala]